ncbi:MAG TPA: hypothetical protein VGV38_05800 [Pyrinomonadaceae bacterium]|nr:hypothetical protein [Pyrinomonadaceae bacterium]
MLVRQLLLALTFSLLAFAAEDCRGGKSSDMSKKPYQYDTPLAKRLEEFRRAGPRGTRRRLEELTDFEWDKVHLFGEGTPFREIDETVGSPLFAREGRYTEQGSLLVFTKAGRVTHAVALVPAFVTGSALTYARASAVLEAYSKDPGPYQLTFVTAETTGTQ